LGRRGARERDSGPLGDEPGHVFRAYHGKRDASPPAAYRRHAAVRRRPSRPRAPVLPAPYPAAVDVRRSTRHAHGSSATPDLAPIRTCASCQPSIGRVASSRWGARLREHAATLSRTCSQRLLKEATRRHAGAAVEERCGRGAARWSSGWCGRVAASGADPARQRSCRGRGAEARRRVPFRDRTRERSRRSRSARSGRW
jgi:hypothetical protein